MVNNGNKLVLASLLAIGAWHTAFLINFFPEGWVSTNPTHVTVVYATLIVGYIGWFLSIKR